jgi:hypothetical protein
MPTLLILYYNGSLSHLNSPKLDHRQVKASYIFGLASPCPVRKHVHSDDFVGLLACCLHDFVI